MPPRVLFLAPQPFFRVRGMCLAQRSLLEALSRMGVETDVLTFPFGDDIEIPGVRILRLPRLPGLRDVPIGPSWHKLILGGLMAFAAAWLCLRRRYALVHACEESAILAAALRPIFGFRLLYDMDDVLSLRVERSGFLRARPALALIRLLERRALEAADAVLTNSPDTTAYARARAPADKVVFYDHASVLAPLDDSEPSMDEARGLDGRKVILYAGNLEPYQGVELLLESLPEVFRASPRACCVVIGGEAGQIASLESRASELGVADGVRWLGKRPIPETLQTMRRSNVLVSPMTQDKAVPMKLYAYMSSGTPIVATDIPCHRSVVDATSAVLVERDPASLAGGILRALEGGEAARRRGERALEGVASLCRGNPAASALLGVYRRLGVVA